ncbi:hypothetical protein MKW98_028849 [Papaver atlanticum]|uniref:Uncharacterized protein n=1 Tax=Papaver atlanticum TaxID=357466 RepID=A0AAD4X749_9MAGN|nr:hypothetical protein MKW98_028849 [Papaver atlanticum]
MVYPSDDRKKNLVNCGVAMQHLKQAWVQLSDEDGVMILAEDVATGEKELRLSLLCNVHLQDYSRCITSGLLDLLLEWIQNLDEGRLKMKANCSIINVGMKQKMALDKQFFSNLGLAKTYTYKKLVEGLFRPAYVEALGNVILKSMTSDFRDFVAGGTAWKRYLVHLVFVGYKVSNRV